MSIIRERVPGSASVRAETNDGVKRARRLLLPVRLVQPTLAVVLLALAPTAMAADLVGTVRKDGKPQANKEVTLRQGGETRQQTKSNSEGRFVFVGIAPGTYRLSCDGDKASEIEIRVSAGASSQDCSLK